MNILTGDNWKAISVRLTQRIAEEHCIECDNIFYGTPDANGRDYCPFCDTYQLLCNLCTIQPDCQECPYEEVK